MPPAADVVVAWVPAGHPADGLAALVRWAATATEPVGLIGCTPSGDRADAEEALAAGFDDFIIGELSVRELAARVRALSRRLHLSANQADEGPRFGSIALDLARHQLWIGGRRVTLTRTELAVMQALVSARRAGPSAAPKSSTPPGATRASRSASARSTTSSCACAASCRTRTSSSPSAASASVWPNAS